MVRRAAQLTAALVLLAGVPAAAPAVAAAGPRSEPVRLKAFASCEALLRFARTNALRTGAVGGIAPRPSGPLPIPIESREGDGPAPALPTPAAGAGDDFSTTNVQEAGIDEPDLIKTDGTTVFAVAGDALHAVEVGGDAPRLRDTLQLSGGYGHALLLHEGRVLVISQASPHAAPPPGPVGAEPARPVTDLRAGDPPTTILTEVDVRDPAAMRIVRIGRAEGYYTSARLTGATARVVLTAAPELAVPTRAAIRASRPATWLPRGVVTSERSGRRRSRRLVPCTSVRRPRSFSGLAMLTVLTIDMDRGLPWVDADAIMSDAQIVYGSPASLYVATQRWIDPSTPVDGLPATVTTQIHRFDAAGAGSTTYRATGEVAGHLLNQFSLSEHDGVLRVASTEEPVWLGGEERRQSESRVTVLEETGGRLLPVGAVGGLGRGERIYSVRFLGDVAYVVTFRQTDPLYTLDLSTPAAPRLAGALKIPGYSAYLHPLDGGLLLGVGQDATDEGTITGTQLSLFDVSDLARPARLRRLTVPFASSEAEADHHAFLYWAPAKLAILPVQMFGETERDTFSGAIGFRIDRASPIAEVGRVEHPAGPEGAAAIRRSLIIGDRVFTLSDRGLLASALDDLAAQTWVPLAPS